jgi:hypothetical protein
VVPLVFMSDATHLTNFAGDKKAWPVYMTIGNLFPLGSQSVCHAGRGVSHVPPG